MPRRAHYGTTYVPSRTMYGGAKRLDPAIVASNKIERKLESLRRQLRVQSERAENARVRADSAAMRAETTAAEYARLVNARG